MQSFDFQQYFDSPTDVGLISASKKFAEVLRAVHEEWSNQEPDFDLDLTGFDYYAKDLFLNEFFVFFSSVHGGVKNRKSLILDPELRKPILKEAAKNLQIFQNCLGDIDTSQTIESQMYVLREIFRDRLIGDYFTQESREMFHGLRPEVEQLDSWIALIFSEVVVSSHFGKGSPTADPIDAAFYLYVKSKEEHVAASLLIGSGLVNEWLVGSPIRGIIGRNELDDDEAYERESLRQNDQI